MVLQLFVAHTLKIHHLFFSGFICGDDCIGHKETCICGNNSFEGDSSGNYYCCSNTACLKDDYGNVECPQGQKLHITENCAKECPAMSMENNIAISSCEEENFCPDSSRNIGYFSKICNGSAQLGKEFLSYCSYINPDADFDFDGVSCERAYNSNNTYQQCYTSLSFYLRYCF